MIKKLVDSVTRRQKQAPLLELCGCVPPLVFAQFKKSAILHHPNFALFDLLLVAIFVGGKEKHSSSPLLLSPSSQLLLLLHYSNSLLLALPTKARILLCLGSL
jgi:hypothetical protein